MANEDFRRRLEEIRRKRPVVKGRVFFATNDVPEITKRLKREAVEKIRRAVERVTH